MFIRAYTHVLNKHAAATDRSMTILKTNKLRHMYRCLYYIILIITRISLQTYNLGPLFVLQISLCTRILYEYYDILYVHAFYYYDQSRALDSACTYYNILILYRYGSNWPTGGERCCNTKHGGSCSWVSPCVRITVRCSNIISFTKVSIHTLFIVHRIIITIIYYCCP